MALRLQRSALSPSSLSQRACTQIHLQPREQLFAAFPAAGACTATSGKVSLTRVDKRESVPTFTAQYEPGMSFFSPHSRVSQGPALGYCGAEFWVPSPLLGIRGCSLLNPHLPGIQVTHWSLSCAVLPLAKGWLQKVVFSPFES